MQRWRKSFVPRMQVFHFATQRGAFRDGGPTFATILGMIPRRLMAIAILLAMAGVFPVFLSTRATGTDPATSVAATLGVAPDLDARLARFKPVEMPFDRSGMSEREQQMVQKLVDAANRIEQIYWRQSDPEGLKIYSQLEKSKDPLDQKVVRFMTINGSRYDLVDELRPFVGNEPAPAGRNLYPRGLTQAEIEQYVAAHPEQKAEVYNEQSLLRLDGGKLHAQPYHQVFAEFLKPAAEDLREA